MRDTPHSLDGSPLQLRHSARRLSAPNIQEGGGGGFSPPRNNIHHQVTLVILFCEK